MYGGILALSLQNELPEAVEGARILNEVLLFAVWQISFGILGGWKICKQEAYGRE
jgi:hypothetical protein